MNIKQQVIILSAEHKLNTTGENLRNTNNLEMMLQECQISNKKGLGSYKGESEECFVCLPKNQDEIETLKDFAFKNFKQESVLYQDSNGQCYLIYSDNREKSLGQLKQVNPKYIEQLENYVILNNTVYTTEK